MVIEDAEHATEIGKRDTLYVMLKQGEAPRMVIEDDGSYVQYWFGVTNPENFKHLQLYSASPSGLANLAVYEEVLPIEFKGAFDDLATSSDLITRLHKVNIRLKANLPKKLPDAVEVLYGIGMDLALLRNVRPLSVLHAKALEDFNERVKSLKDVYDMDYSQKEISNAIDTINSGYTTSAAIKPLASAGIKKKLEQRSISEAERNRKAEERRELARRDSVNKPSRKAADTLETKSLLESILKKLGFNVAAQRASIRRIKDILKDTELHQYIEYEARNYIPHHELFAERGAQFLELVQKKMGNFNLRELGALTRLADPRLQPINGQLLKREEALQKIEDDATAEFRAAQQERAATARQKARDKAEREKQRKQEEKEKRHLAELERQRQRDLLYNGDLFGKPRSEPLDLTRRVVEPVVDQSTVKSIEPEAELNPDFFHETDAVYATPNREYRQKVQQFIRSMPSPVTRYNAPGEVFVSDGKSLAGILLSSMDVDRRKNTRNAYTGTVPGRVQLTMNIQGRYESNMMGLLRSLNSLGFELKMDDNFKVIAKHKTHRIAVTLSLYPNSHNTWSRFRMVIAGADSEIRKLSSIEI